MSPQISPITDPDLGRPSADGDAGLGTLRTERGNLPLERLDLLTRITGLIGHTDLEQGFHNPYDEPLEATYVFPLPDRAAVTGMRMTADDRVIEATLAERAHARAAYDQAIAAGRRAAIAEEERPDVFTMRVGNILPGERVTITLTLAGPLSYEDGEATFRFPLVVAPRYIPGQPLPGGQVGDGYALDTDAVPDASRITPPVLLPGFPNPVRLGIEIRLDPGGLPLARARCSLPIDEANAEADSEGTRRWRVRPGQRADRDLVLRLAYGDPVNASHALAVAPDPDRDREEGTFQLTVLPPTDAAPPRPRDVVLVLDRSGSMRGWKMATARRAAARIVDTLTAADRFAVLTFDNVVERPPALPAGLVAGTDRHRFQAVEHLAAVQARGGTQLLAPLREALALLADATPAGDDEARHRVLVLVTDGQVGNEDQILRESAAALAGVRVHTVGIDQAVNAGFLGRLAAAGGGRCELVESADRLDEAADRIHRRIGAPLVTGVSCQPENLGVLPETIAPARVPDLFPGAPLVVTGRYRGSATGAMRVAGTDATGAPWQARADASIVDSPALAAVWARAHLRDLEDRYAAASRAGVTELERHIVETSLRFSVLCRFTAYVATDTRTVTDGATPHRVIQPVESPAGWDFQVAAPSAMPAFGAPGAAAPTSAAGVIGMRVQSAMLATGPSNAPPVPARPPVRKREPVPGPVPVDAFAAEAARLRAATGAPEPERRMVLADLASRLEALLRQRHPDPGAPEAALVALRELLAELREDAALRLPADRLAELWERMQRLLDTIAAGSGSVAPPPGAPQSPAPPRRGAFWKRT